jgi:TonB family protein
MARFYQSVNYHPCTLKELDRIPTPLAAPAPYYTPELLASGLRGKVTVDFYIDESGMVRMPAVSDADRRDLATLAVMAVRQWRFEPPLRKGNPVLVKARQVFTFGDDKR